MEYKQLEEIFCRHEREHPGTHLTAYITFLPLDPPNEVANSWKYRTYRISSDNEAFQPNTGGYSIYGSSLSRIIGPLTCLNRYISDEYYRKGGSDVEDCCIVCYLLIECSDCSISAPKLFYAYNDALECMLSRLAEIGGLDAEQIKNDLYTTEEVFEEDCYRVGWDSAWLTDPSVDWHWQIQPVCIYGPTKIVFPEQEDKSYSV